jgi:hypothetical protein
MSQDTASASTNTTRGDPATADGNVSGSHPKRSLANLVKHDLAQFTTRAKTQRALTGYQKGRKERIMGSWHTRQGRPYALSAAAARTCARSANSSTQ